MQKLFLRKNEKNIEVNKSSGDERLPYFSLYIIPEEKEGKWLEVGAGWRSKSGKGYNMRLSKGVELVIPSLKVEKEEEIGWD